MHMSYQIRKIRSGDAPALMRFYNELSAESKQLFHPMGPRASLEQCVAICENNTGHEPDRYDLIALAGSKVMGWCFLWDLREQKVSLGLGVADEWQGKGLGRALMRSVMEFVNQRQFPQVRLTCVKDNAVAQRLYESFGFQHTGEHIGDDGLNYVEMKIKLAH
jgi:putative acetyltransferase